MPSGRRSLLVKSAACMRAIADFVPEGACRMLFRKAPGAATTGRLASEGSQTLPAHSGRTRREPKSVSGAPVCGSAHMQFGLSSGSPVHSNGNRYSRRTTFHLALADAELGEYYSFRPELYLCVGKGMDEADARGDACATMRPLFTRRFPSQPATVPAKRRHVVNFHGVRVFNDGLDSGSLFHRAGTALSSFSQLNSFPMPVASGLPGVHSRERHLALPQTLPPSSIISQLNAQASRRFSSQRSSNVGAATSPVASTSPIKAGDRQSLRYSMSGALSSPSITVDAARPEGISFSKHAASFGATGQSVLGAGMSASTSSAFGTPWQRAPSTRDRVQLLRHGQRAFLGHRLHALLGGLIADNGDNVVAALVHAHHTLVLRALQYADDAERRGVMPPPTVPQRASLRSRQVGAIPLSASARRLGAESLVRACSDSSKTGGDQPHLPWFQLLPVGSIAELRPAVRSKGVDMGSRERRLAARKAAAELAAGSCASIGASSPVAGSAPLGGGPNVALQSELFTHSGPSKRSREGVPKQIGASATAGASAADGETTSCGDSLSRSQEAANITAVATKTGTAPPTKVARLVEAPGAAEDTRTSESSPVPVGTPWSVASHSTLLPTNDQSEIAETASTPTLDKAKRVNNSEDNHPISSSGKVAGHTHGLSSPASNSHVESRGSLSDVDGRLQMAALRQQYKQLLEVRSSAKFVVGSFLMLN